MAASEQSKVLNEEKKIRDQLLALGEEYKAKFGMKFLISAQGKSATELLGELKKRMSNPLATEIENARGALWEITKKRMVAQPLNDLREKMEALRQKHGVRGMQLALCSGNEFIETVCLGERAPGKPVTPTTYFELASLSKTLASAFALDYLAAKNINLSASVNQLLATTRSKFRLRSETQPAWADQTTVADLMRHTALNMHYVNGVPADRPMPKISQLLQGNPEYGYGPVTVQNKPGDKFQYSGGGYLVLEHLLESMEGRSIFEMTTPYLESLGARHLTFAQEDRPGLDYAHGFQDDGTVVAGTRKMFPAFAAGSMGTAEGMLRFLRQLERSYHEARRRSPLSHDTAALMLHAQDRGSVEFMGARMGLGVFVAEAGENKIALHQGANDGFRALYLYCFAGPNRGQGFTILCNGELKAVCFISEVARLLLEEFHFEGVDFKKLGGPFEATSFKPEEVVNRGYKEMIFAAFEPCRPDAIVRRGKLDPLSRYDRAQGSTVLSCTNDRFARAENLIDPHVPLFEPDLYCAQGKVMDSWESVRHNPKESEDLVLQLPRPAKVRFVSFSTAYHNGNQVPAVSLEGIEKGKEAEGRWLPVIPKISLDGHAVKNIRVQDNSHIQFSQLRVRTYPDGGLSRLRIFDEELPAAEQAHFLEASQARSIPLSDPIPQTHKPLALPFENILPISASRWKSMAEGCEVDLASAVWGGSVVSASNQHYGSAAQTLSPFAPLHMFDGFESARSRTPGHFEVLHLKLGHAAPLHRLEFDFTWYVNNNPRAVRVEGLGSKGWKEIVPTAEVKAFAANTKVFHLSETEVLQELKVYVYPDGGINRIRAYGLKN